MASDTSRRIERLREAAFRSAGRGMALTRHLADPPGVYAAIGALLVALFVTTSVVVARFEHAREVRAESLFEKGQEAISAGRLDEAIADLRAALALDRRNPDYGLALAGTLLQAGRSQEAASYLDAVLAERPTSGPGNLTRARAVRMLGDLDQAIVYYRRAADGTWPPGRGAERVDVRFEMVEYLVGRSRLAEAGVVLSELRLAAPDEATTRLRLARLLLLARLPGDAAEELRSLTVKTPGDSEAWAMLAQAEFALDNDAAARTAGRRALQGRPDDQPTRLVVSLATETLALDPSLPRLRNAERARRARQLLVNVVDASSACLVGREVVPDALARLRAQSRQFLRSRASADTDPVEDAIQLAETLWTTTASVCSDTPGRFAVLDRLLRRLQAARTDG